MSLFLDSGVLVAFVNTRDSLHERASALLDAARRGAYGSIVTSDYVFDEAVTLALARSRRPEPAIRLGELVLGTGDEARFINLAYVSARVFLRSWALFRGLAERGLSFTDCTTVELMRALRFDEVASFDRDFDGLVPRRSDAD